MANKPVFLGKWKLVSNQGLYDFMDAVGLKLPRDNNIVMHWTTSPDGYFVQGFDATDQGSTRLFMLDKEIEFEGSDGRIVKLTLSLKGNVLTETRVYDGKQTVVIERKFNGDKMEANLSGDGLPKASAQFEKIISVEFK